MYQPSREELNTIVKVTANVTAAWDGKEYDLSKGAEIGRGAAEFWQAKNPNVTFMIEDIIPALPPMGEIKNPLEVNGRGEAFAGLKRGRSKKDGD